MATTITDTPVGPAPVDTPTSTAARLPWRARTAGLLTRRRSALVCLGFLVLSLLQQPGKVLGDTKLDLAVDPLAFLGRALALWEPEGAAGQVQNQAYGYFFPMGPFFALGDLAGLPAWVVQRLWFALLLSAAFLGVVVLARRLGIGTPGTVLVAGIAYALAPRMVTALGATSVELIPMALTPWVLVPLAGVARHGSARRAATLSGLAVFCVGGVNAVATSAVLPLAVLFLLTRPAGRLRRRLVAWWVVAVGLATAWWVGPLLLLGRYSPAFLDYIETAQNTTGPTDVLSVLRGTSHWVATLATSSGPVLPAGWSLVHDVVPAAATVVVAAAGLAALCRRDMPERTWLVLGLLAGVGLVSLGHLAQVQGLLADVLHDALDGPLAPLRNVHKFDPVLRLPLVLGLAHLGAVLVRRTRRDTAAPGAWGPPWWQRAVPGASRTVLAVLAVALVATVSPALAGRLAPPTGFTEVPGYWRQTADFLAAEQSSGRALLVPGSSFGTYEWGVPNDEPMQPLAESPWDVRNAIPLTPEGHIRALDAVEARLARGEGSEGLSRYLARAGISHLVLRNDLDTGASGSTRSVLVRQALRDSPGIVPVAAFGPQSPGVRLRDGLVFDAGLAESAPAVEVYTVADAAPRAWTAPLSSAVTVHGGPEGVLALEDRGVVSGRPTVMAGGTTAATEPAGPTMVSDALVRRERNFGRVAGATSGGLSADDPLRLESRFRDYQMPDLDEAESVVDYVGAMPSASSSASDPDGFVDTRLDAQPWSAVDNDPLTAWRPAGWAATSEPSWWRLTADRLFLARTVEVTLGQEPGAQRPTELRLTTDTGELTVPVEDTGEPQELPLPEGYSATLTIASTAPGDTEEGRALALAEVRVPGVTVARSVAIPPAGAAADVFAFDAQEGRPGCVVDAAGAPRCAAVLAAGGEEGRSMDRTFSTDTRDRFDLALTAVPRPGGALDALLTEVRESVQVEGSSAQLADPRASAAAAVDGDPATSWLARSEDRRPTLELTFPEPRTVDSLRVVTAPGLPAAVPTAVTVDDGGLPRTLRLADDGSVGFAPVVTDRLEVVFELPDEVESVDPRTRWKQPLGIGISELEIGGPNPAADPGTPVTLPCGAGPTVRIDGVVLATTARTTLADLQDLRPVTLEPCDAEPSVALPPGGHRVIGTPSELMVPESVTLVRTDAPVTTEAAVREPAEIDRWDAEQRTVQVGARDEPGLLVVPENTNSGWTARLDGEELRTLTVDGWQQGYVLPAGEAGTVTLEFVPGTAYREALLTGAGTVLLLVLVAVVPARPSRSGPPRRPRLVASAAAVLVPVALVGVALFGAALVGGVVGVAALVGLWAVAELAGRWRSAVLGTAAVGALLTAGALLLVVPDGTGTVRQLLAILSLSAVVAGILPRLPVPRRGDREIRV